ncbi:MAG: MSCRAMM family adhesin SdrC, partial [Planctomycetes bacterium]|nr:MSCRAMM family adhesin SdrC [Planctomycetota bacterium]
TAGVGNAYEKVLNTALIESFDNEGNPSNATASDSVTYQDLKPAIDLLKLVDPGEVLESGGLVEYRYELRNTSVAGMTDPLRVLSLLDDKAGDILANYSSFTGDDGDGLLESGETWVFKVWQMIPVGDATGGSYTNIAMVSAVDDEGNAASDESRATVRYRDELPETIQLAKGHDGTLDEGKSGQVVVYHYTVGNNTGSVEPLYVSKLSDTINLPGGKTVVVDLLGLFQAANPNMDKSRVDPEQVISFDYSFTAGVGNAYEKVLNTALIESFDNEGNPSNATASDSVTYQDLKPAISITKTPDISQVPPGGAVTFTYELRNTSLAGAVDPLVIDSIIDTDGTPTYRGGDTNTNGKLDTDEVWLYDLKVTINTLGDHTNTVTVQAHDDETNPTTGQASATVSVSTFCCTTYTIGGYAGTGEPGRYLRANFSGAYPGGLTVPRPAVGSAKDIILLDSTQVQSFLRAVKKQPFSNANVKNYVPSTLEKQFVALSLNVRFDDYDPNFNADAVHFGDLLLRDLTGSLAWFNGSNVRTVLALSYSYLDGGNPFPSGISAGDLTSLLDNLNKSFDNGRPSAWAVSHLIFPTPSPLATLAPSTPASASPPKLVTGEVWFDRNMNGKMDWNEPGMKGVTVRLSNGGGGAIASTVTDKNGYYNFANLPDAEYSVKFVTPRGFAPTIPGASAAVASRVALAPTQDDCNCGCDLKAVFNAGFRALTKRTGGKDSGYYLTSDGRQEVTGSSHGKKLSCEVYDYLFDSKSGVLRNTDDRSKKLSVLVDGNGQRMRLDFFKTYENLAAYLSASSGNMAQALSRQLLVTELNMLAGRIRGSMVVLTSAITNPATGAPIPSPVLRGLSTAPMGASPWTRITPVDGGIAQVQNAVDSSIRQLLANRLTIAAGGNRLYQRGLMQVLAGINAGQAILV